MKKTVWAVLAAALVLCLAASFGLQRGIDARRGGIRVAEELGRLPKAEYIKRVSFGYETLVADFIWLKTIQVMGDKNIPPENADWIYHAIDVASDLDPKFWYMYEAGGVFLSSALGNYQDSVALLVKGFHNNPDQWQLPFYAGAINFLYLQNYKQAAYYMGRAALLPGRPPFVPLLATRLYAEAGDPRYAIDIVDSILAGAKDPKVREALEERKKQLIVEANLDGLERAAAAYKAHFGRYPASVRELVEKGVIRGVPADPYGGGYSLDPLTGKAASTVMKNRLRVYKKEKG